MKRRNGGDLTLEDFLPDSHRQQKKRRNPQASEAKLKSALMALTRRSAVTNDHHV